MSGEDELHSVEAINALIMRSPPRIQDLLLHTPIAERGEVAERLGLLALPRCTVCGEELPLGRRSTSQYCSAACKQKAYRDRWR